MIKLSKLIFILGSILAAILVIIFFLAKTLSEYSITNLNISVPMAVQQDFQDANFESSSRWYGLCKKNSIRSIQDFRKTISNDLVLQTHFPDFRWEKAKMGKLEKRIWVLIHYREGTKIFQKPTPILLPAGDDYITDGLVWVRVNCCNSYINAPVAPTFDLNAAPSAGFPDSAAKIADELQPFGPESVRTPADFPGNTATLDPKANPSLIDINEPNTKYGLGISDSPNPFDDSDMRDQSGIPVFPLIPPFNPPDNPYVSIDESASIWLLAVGFFSISFILFWVSKKSIY